MTIDRMHDSPPRPIDAHAHLQCAIDAARHAGLEAQTGGCFGAVVIDNHSGRILGTGFNQVVSTNDPTAHAEVQAIRNACTQNHTFHLRDTTLYTTSEPCPMCLAAAYWARISKVYYLCPATIAQDYGNFADCEFYNELTHPPHSRSLPVINISSHYPQEYTQMLDIWYRYSKLNSRVHY